MLAARRFLQGRRPGLADRALRPQSRPTCARVGKDGVGDNGVRFAAAGAAADAVDPLFPVSPGRESLPIVVAGARNAAISMVVRVFGGWSASSVRVEAAPASVAAVGG